MKKTEHSVNSAKGESKRFGRRTRFWRSMSWTALLVFLTGCLLAVFAGVGTFTFVYGEGGSYFSNNPNACANCHAMQDHLESWQKSSHAHVAVCNDCHLPHDFVGKWFTKADNGLLHSWAFTFDNYHDPIQIKPRNRRVTQSTCISCHEDLLHGVLAAKQPDTSFSCIHCHSDVGHALKR